jgi:hypothetical protein
VTYSIYLRRILGGFLFLSVCAQIALLGCYLADHRYLRAVSERIVDRSAPPSEQTKQILGFFRGKSQRTNSSYFLFPFFDFLRPTARQVAEKGGDCADRSRLTVILLQMRDIPAEKWTLYYPEGHPEHTIVEVTSEQGKMAVDPLFGLFFPRPSGGYYSVSDLRSNPTLVRERVQQMEERHEEPLAAQIERYPVEQYTYAYAKTLNWDKSAVFRATYKLLHAFWGNRVNDIARPAWPEEPALVLIVALCLAEIPASLFLFLLWRAFSRGPRPVAVSSETMRRRRGESIPAQVS